MPGMAYQFDPMGLPSNPEMVPWFREAELKHGRVWCARAASSLALSRARARGFSRARVRSPRERRSAGSPTLSARAAARRALPPRLPRPPTRETPPREHARARPLTRALASRGRAACSRRSA